MAISKGDSQIKLAWTGEVMPKWMIQDLTAGWPMIASNVPTFLAIVVLMAVALWFVLNWAYGGVIGRKNSQIELQDRQLADYKHKLEGATPQEAKDKIDQLELKVRDARIAIERTTQKPNQWRAIHITVRHIGGKIGDSEAKNCWEGSRLALRQAAYDKRIRVKGKRQMSEPSPFAGRREYSDIYTDVDSDYWADSNINALATSPEMQTSYHSDPQTAYAWGKLGLNERNRFYDLQVNWDDISGEWP